MNGNNFGFGIPPAIDIISNCTWLIRTKDIKCTYEYDLKYNFFLNKSTDIYKIKFPDTKYTFGHRYNFQKQNKPSVIDIIIKDTKNIYSPPIKVYKTFK